MSARREVSLFMPVAAIAARATTGLTGLSCTPDYVPRHYRQSYEELEARTTLNIQDAINRSLSRLAQMQFPMLPVVGMSSSLTTGGGKGGLVDRLGSVSQSTTPQAQQ